MIGSPVTDKVYVSDHDTKPCHEVIPVHSVRACIRPDILRRQGLGNIKGKRKCGFWGGVCE